MLPDAPIWTGNMRDDCIAFWRGLILRAENLGQGWWWAVSTDCPTFEDLASCWDFGGAVPGGARSGGRHARLCAEAAAEAIVSAR